MSMFGAVDLSTLAPRGAQPAQAAGAGAPAVAVPGAAAGNGGAAGTYAAGAAAPGGAGMPGAGVPGAAGAQAGIAAELICDLSSATLNEAAQLSTQVPVVVVGYAPSAQASVDFVTVMEEQAAAYAGAFQLARLNVEAEAAVAQMLGITAVPTVLALIAAQPVPMFQGSATGAEVQPILKQLVDVANANGVSGRLALDAQPAAPAEETELERTVRLALEAGDYAAAEEAYTHAINNAPADASLRTAREQVRFQHRIDGMDPAATLAAADSAPQDLSAALAAADAALLMGDVHGCLGRILEAVRSHQGEEREEARERALQLFEVIGTSTPEVAQARRQLATLLF